MKLNFPPLINMSPNQLDFANLLKTPSIILTDMICGLADVVLAKIDVESLLQVSHQDMLLLEGAEAMWKQGYHLEAILLGLHSPDSQVFKKIDSMPLNEQELVIPKVFKKMTSGYKYEDDFVYEDEFVREDLFKMSKKLTSDDFVYEDFTYVCKRIARMKECGVAWASFYKATKRPHFVNIDRIPSRSQRFLFFVKSDGETVFGKEGDIQAFALKESKQCVVTANDDKFTITELSGENYHNGKPLEKGVSVPLTNYDRVAMGSEIMLFRVPAEVTDEMVEPDVTTIFK